MDEDRVLVFCVVQVVRDRIMSSDLEAERKVVYVQGCMEKIRDEDLDGFVFRVIVRRGGHCGAKAAGNYNNRTW